MSKITLTDDTLTNIKIMAPELDKVDQERALGVIIGIAMMTGKDVAFNKTSEPQRKA